MFETSIVKAFQSLRCGFLDTVLSGVTLIGDELFFILAAVVFYWCVDKRFGFKLINVYLLGCCVIEGVKTLVKRPRPYTHEGVVSVTKPTGGYSFPSGHSHSIANLSTQAANRYRNKPTYIATAVLCALVAFSRVYLGQHFLSDVLVGLAFGIGFSLLFSMLFELLGEKEEFIVLGVVPICLIVLLVLALTDSLDASANVQKVLGGYSAVTLGYYIEKKYIRYDVKTRCFVRIINAVIGLALTLAVKEGFKLFIPKELSVLYGFVRYFVTGLMGTAGVMLVFKLLDLDGRIPGKKTVVDTLDNE